MKYIELLLTTEITTRSELREAAIDWQSHASEQNYSYGELAEVESFLRTHAERLDMVEELEENGII